MKVFFGMVAWLAAVVAMYAVLYYGSGEPR